MNARYQASSSATVFLVFDFLQPIINLQIARAYLSASDLQIPGLLKLVSLRK
jgi:hypothetical protein